MLQKYTIACNKTSQHYILYKDILLNCRNKKLYLLSIYNIKIFALSIIYDEKSS